MVVIDIGGGVTDYIVYHNGVVRQSGVIAIGGDHITNDLCIGLRIPITRAEKLKIEEGSASLENILGAEKITLKNDTGFSGKEIDRSMLNHIIHSRLHELFGILRNRIQDVVPIHLLGSGIILTGGAASSKGFARSRKACLRSRFTLPMPNRSRDRHRLLTTLNFRPVSDSSNTRTPSIPIILRNPF